MSCDNLCTAAKCQELEERLGRLEQIVDLLEASFEAHTNQPIPQAHDYDEPEVSVDLSLNDQEITTTVKVGKKSDSSTITLPEFDPDVGVEITTEEKTVTVKINVNDKSGQDTFTLPDPKVILEITEIDTSNFNFKVDVDGISSEDILTIPKAQAPFVTLDIFPTGNDNYVFKVGVDGEFDQDTLDLSKPFTETETTVNVNTYRLNNNLVFSVSVNGESDTDYVSLPEIPYYEEHVKSNLVGSASFYNEILTISIADGESQDTFQVNIPIPEIPEIPESEKHVKSNLVGSASFYNEILTISIADGESQDTFQVNIPIPEIPETEEHVKSNLVGSASFYDGILTISIADGESQDVFQVNIPIPEIPEMDCSNLEESIRQLAITINNEFNNLNIEINNLENEIKDDIEEVKDVVTVDISGTANNKYKCEFELDNNDNPIPGYAKSLKESKSYSGIGLKGIHENLKVINSNLDALHSDICKAIDPISTITTDDLYKFCNHSNIKRTDFPEGTVGDEQYDNAILQYLTDLFEETKYAYLLANVSNNKLVTAPNNWITNYLADFSLIQGKINNAEICNLEIPEVTDVVSIVASPKYETNVEGKVLVLHFVTFDNYPKRMSNSTYWQIQIPGAKESYVWENDFKDLTWNRGNQYAELKLKDYRARVSGWFQSKSAANAYFDAVLQLTTAEEENRIYPEHKTPKSNVIARVTRPYRAFIESVNEFGQAICHIKYVPPVENPDE